MNKCKREKISQLPPFISFNSSSSSVLPSTSDSSCKSNWKIMKEIEINCKDSFQYIRTNELRVNTMLQWKRNRTFTCGSKGLTSLMDWFFNLRAKNFSISFLMRNPCSTVWWREQEPFSREKRQLCWRRDALFGERKTIFYENYTLRHQGYCFPIYSSFKPSIILSKSPKLVEIHYLFLAVG